MKKHKHRYRMELDKSVVGVYHAWFFGHCVKRGCTARIDRKYIDMNKVERSGNILFSYYLNES